MDAMPVGDTAETYNPYVHTAMWQNDIAFVVNVYNKRMKICRGCIRKFFSLFIPSSLYSKKSERVSAKRRNYEMHITTAALLALDQSTHISSQVKLRLHQKFMTI